MGIALSPTELFVMAPGGIAAQPARRITLDRMSAENGAAWPALADALRELAHLHGSGGRLAVALMPGLAELRRLELPPLGDDELRQLLTRNAARYFIDARSPQIVGVLATARRRKGAPIAVIAAAAPSRLLSAIVAAGRDSGWEVESVSLAEGAWASAAAELWPASARVGLLLLVVQGDRTDLLEISGRRLVGTRRFRADERDLSLMVDAIASRRAATRAGNSPRAEAPPVVAAIGDGAARQALSAALRARGITLVPPSSAWSETVDSPALVAAGFSGPDARPVLESDAVRGERARRTRGVILGAAAGAAALFVLAAALHLWGVHRELAAVQAQRAALRPEVAATLVGRTSVETAFRQLAALAVAQRTAPHWAGVVAALSEKLDTDAYLTAFRGRDDSLVVDGLAVHAARVFDAMERTPGLTGAHAAAPVRREAPSGGPAMERFTIAARVAPGRPAAPAVAKVAR